jgi:hypothetical protein
MIYFTDKSVKQTVEKSPNRAFFAFMVNQVIDIIVNLQTKKPRKNVDNYKLIWYNLRELKKIFDYYC